MEVIVNGLRKDVPTGTTVSGLLATEGLAGKPCAVEINKQVVPRRDHADRALATGDVVELVTLVGGG
ncbi:MAG: sulfur carrier protein ThiS [Phycisphaerales bacterium]|nr:MAG: sulfur carrier protein ThiS [Phycisphaerales bacterium]